MAARHYDGRFWAMGETAWHSRFNEAQNRIKKLRKQIKMWQEFAERTPGERAQTTAARQIAACKAATLREESNAAGYAAEVEKWEERCRKSTEVAA